MLLAGGAGVVTGIAIPDRLHALLPPVVIDAAAIGGATVALGVAMGVVGLAQLLMGLLLGRGSWAAAGVVSLGLLAALFLALGVALLTEVAAGADDWLVAPGACLLVLAGLYGVAAWRLAAVRTAPPGEGQAGR
jgi:hypothetical protein